MAKTRQIRTNPDTPVELAPEQQTALSLVLTGRTDAEIGEAVGVTRQTVCTWRNGDNQFKAALRTARRDLWDAQQERMRSLISRALDVLSEDLGSEDLRLRQAAAVHILKSCALYGSKLEPPDPVMAGLLDFTF